MIDMTGEQSLQYQTEIRNAIQARDQGLDGRARVCIRRAAGLLAKIWLDANFPGPRDPNLLTCLKELSNLELLHADLQNLVTHFTTNVDAAYQLPAYIDLFTDLADLQIGLGISTKDNDHD
jgi:hypothetical protein